MLVGYTTLMAPEAMDLPYLECLLSWAAVCDKIAICYSTFPKLDIPIPDGAICPWEDDGSLEILEKFDKEVLGSKLVLVKHEWDPDNPREDGVTKQLARQLAIQACGDDQTAWLAQFDGDEILREEDIGKVINFIQEQVEHPSVGYATAGIIEMFGDINKVRFGFANWLKIRFTKATGDIVHDLLYSARARNPVTKKLIAKDNGDDGAGMVFRFNYSRPDYNKGAWLFDPRILSHCHAALQGQAPLPQAQQALQDGMDTGIWIWHTSWIDIARKWRMGWFFDNFWSVLNGKQDTFIEKAEEKGTFTHTREPEKLEEELAAEMARPGIMEIANNKYPIYFQQVTDWRTGLTKEGSST